MMIQREIRLILTAFMFYSRIPVPENINHSEDDINLCTKYFPLVGIVVGCLAALVYWLGNLVFPRSVAIIFSMVAGVLITGAFHEDGFADVCDGFGGGWTSEDRLRIMKDSRIGSYGTIGIFFMLLLKFYLLYVLAGINLIIVLITAHTFSRLMPVYVIFTGRYARNDATSKVKPIGKSITYIEFINAALLSLTTFFLFRNAAVILILVLPFLSTLWLKHYFEKRIDGYTGDCLGAIQQVSEIGIYISFYILADYSIWNF